MAKQQRNLQHIRESDMFDDVEKDICGLIDPAGEQVVNIDIDELDNESVEDAKELIGSISKLYGDEEFIKKQPGFKKRVDAELESLRINFKMRKADELAHDILLKNVGMNPSNASMYKALTELQKTIIAITSKIEDSLTKLSNLLKNYQTEINFDDQNDADSAANDGVCQKTYKGSKQFIEAMENQDDDDIDIPQDDDDSEF